jgi:hypothetical protein
VKKGFIPYRKLAFLDGLLQHFHIFSCHMWRLSHRLEDAWGRPLRPEIGSTETFTNRPYGYGRASLNSITLPLANPLRVIPGSSVVGASVAHENRGFFWHDPLIMPQL